MKDICRCITFTLLVLEVIQVFLDESIHPEHQAPGLIVLPPPLPREAAGGAVAEEPVLLQHDLLPLSLGPELLELDQSQLDTTWVLLHGHKSGEVADGDLCPWGNGPDCSDLLEPLLFIPDKLGHRDTGVVEPGDPEEQPIVTPGAGLTQGEVVRSPDAVHSLLLVFRDF